MGQPLFRPSLDRRAFLMASTSGLASLGFARGLRASTGPAAAAPALAKPAKSTVLFNDEAGGEIVSVALDVNSGKRRAYDRAIEQV